MDSLYAPLSVHSPGQLRLITIEPGELDDPIVLKMTCASLNDPDTQFEGLSYTWGDTADPMTIYCNGIAFEATRNLYSSLRRLRAIKRSTLWIDAICINQKDREERASQVKQMHDIYSKAKPVWIDLGDALPIMQKVFDLMKKLVEVLGDDENDTRLIDYKKFEELGLPPWDDVAWYHWQETLARPYFRRVWVIQEFTLPKEMYFMIGTTFFPWWNLYWITWRMRNRGISEDVRPKHPSMSSVTRLNAIKGWNGLRYQYQCHYTHHEIKIPLKTTHLLHQVRDVDASDPKDKIYGIVGIAGDIDLTDPDFEIKYDDIETVAQVFTRTARGLIRGEKRRALDCLAEGGSAYTPRLSDLPSWIPDWTAERAGKTLGFDDNIYHAADSRPLHATVEGSVLEVQGRIIDRISHLTSAYRPDRDHDHTDVYYGISVARWLRQAFDLVLSIWPHALDNDGETADVGIKESLWRTLICNKGHDEQLAGLGYAESFEHLLARQRFVEEALFDHTNDEQLAIEDSDGQYERNNTGSMMYRVALQNSMFTKSFCITQQQRMLGMVPGDARIGDYVVLVAGSPVPFVMRLADPVDEMSKKWILVQECYVHGVMNGEHAQEGKGATWEEILIV